MDLPVLENVTRPIRAGPFSDADLFSIYMMRVFGIDPHTDPPLARTNRPLPAPAFALRAMAERAGRDEAIFRAINSPRSSRTGRRRRCSAGPPASSRHPALARDARSSRT